jgi:hypothetical protein
MRSSSASPIRASKHSSCPKAPHFCHCPDRAVKKIFAVFLVPLRCVQYSVPGSHESCLLILLVFFHTHKRPPGWQAHQRLVHRGSTERNIVFSRQLADTTAASCFVFHTIHRLRYLRGRFRRALRHCGHVDHFLRQGQVGKLFRRGTIIAHLDLVVYARSSSGGRECS